MPIYEYRCSNCQTKFEVIRAMKDSDAEIPCKSCNSADTKRVLSLCYAKSEGRSTSSGSHGCGGCSGGSCSSCSH
ncbi:MAG: FmdB family regulatory protein [Chloroflexi bacterium]|nr:MAG: FmdB family regulatory protein [Chloroflexota bacterium]MBA4374695.1 FmdB family transcriptional regulator [Anaerolinea sp.]